MAIKVLIKRKFPKNKDQEKELDDLKKQRSKLMGSVRMGRGGF